MPEGILSHILSRPRNNFNLIRIVAATAVILSHSFPLTGRPEVEVAGLGLGALAVAVFFAVSGYLIAGSWNADAQLGRFIKRRALRIMPGLLVVSTLATFVLGPLITTVPISHYLTTPATWGYWTKTNLLDTWSGTLPGVFAHVPTAGTVNGSLWTLPIEAMSYGIVALLGITLGRRGLGPKAFLITAGVFVIAHLLVRGLVGQSGSPVETTTADSLWLCAIFMASAAIKTAGTDPTRPWPLIPSITFAAVVGIWGGPVLKDVALLPLVVYGTLYLAHHKRRPLEGTLAKLGDPSYGMYIYAWPVQQTLAVAGVAAGGPFVMFALASTIALAFGTASWILVERPMLSLKPRSA